jgi:cytochrome c-type biogenesis protein CcmH/NrfG
MAKVSLRIYTREIEGLVDQGHTDEAIAHCRHILKTFPKHLETYRLLGKAYLEARRYGEAVDIFSRILMAAPEDFVSHVGMSIINDEQNQLDNAIWHMERAFEVQPSNPAIQGELQRLYARRDGMEPPKIRMTRGALANMYVQGELYPQAIAEIKAVLAQDSQRTDMQVLLARAYFKAGQKAEASDLCNQLLKKHLYCFDANRIMVDLLPATPANAEATQMYRTRVGELDPYATFSKGSVFQSNEVADGAVNLDRLEYTGEEVPIGQEWSSSLGINLGSTAGSLSAGSADDQPDWLKAAANGYTPSQSVDPFASSQSSGAEAGQAGVEIPDFLRQAGWAESSGPEQPVSFFDSAEPAAGANDSLVSADIPDWLKGQMPSSAPAQTSASVPPEAIETPDWLSSLGGAQAVSFDTSQGVSQPAQPVETPDWLSGLGTPEFTESAPAQESNTPDWLSGLDGSQSAEPAQQSNAPDWLAGLETPETATPAATEANVPDWLRGLEGGDSGAEQQTGVPDWLSGLGEAVPAAPVEGQPKSGAPDWLNAVAEPKESEAIKPSGMPDWLSGLEDTSSKAQVPPSNIESLGASAQEQDDAVAWLESLAAKHGAKPEELVTDPNKRNETPPDWVQQAQSAGQPQAAANVESLGASAQEQDDAVAWLESLAAKHGAKPEELVTDPNKRNETPPDWVQQASAGSQQPAEIKQWSENAQNIGEQFFAEFEETPAAPVASVENLGASAQEQDDAVAWLESLAAKHGAKPEELVTDPNKRSATPPDWVQQASAASEIKKQEEEKTQFSEAAQNIGEQFFADFEAAAGSTESDDTGMWLKNLAEQEQQEKIAPAQPAGIPDWLSAAEETPEVPKQSDLPNWMTDSTEEPASQEFVSENLSQEDLSNWLSNLDDGTSETETVEKPHAKIAEPARTGKSDLPAWLGGLDKEEQTSEEEWKAPTPASAPTEEPAPVKLTADLPDWLQSVDEETQLPSDEEDEDTPPWMRRETWEAGEEEKPQPMPTSPSDWHPIEPKPDLTPRKVTDLSARPPMPKPKPTAQQLKHEPEDDVPSIQQPPRISKPPVTPAVRVSQQPAMQQPVEQKPQQPVEAPVVKAAKPSKKVSGMPKPEAQGSSPLLEQAKGELDRGDIPGALEHYEKLIKKGRHLEETIRDLSESLYRYPVEVGIWQTLGDAYMRANRLKEALEAYNKAEELIR